MKESKNNIEIKSLFTVGYKFNIVKASKNHPCHLTFLTAILHELCINNQY